MKGTTDIALGPIESRASETPDKAAIVDGDVSLTYGELNLRADALAEALANAGVGQGSVVATKLRTRWEWFVINFALSKLSAMHVSASYSLSGDEVRHLVSESAPILLISDAPESDAEHAQPARLLPLDGCDDWSVRAMMSRTPASRRQGHLPASLVIFTAGTSGTPKGAVIDFSSLDPKDPDRASYLADQQRRGRSGPWVKSLFCRPLHHLAGPFQARSCLVSGGTLYMLRKFDALAVLQMISENGITHLGFVPTMAHRIMALPAEVRQRYDVSSVRMLHLGGAPTTTELKEALIDYFGPDCLFEGYGSTELQYVTVMEPPAQLEHPGSCGKVYDGIEVRILAEDGRVLPAGEVGEILVRTPMLFAGYLKNGVPVRENVDEDGFFHTGDAGRLDEDNYLYVVGRLKDMLIRGGVNIYPAEIEAALLRQPAVVDAAVFGVPDADLGEIAVAYCELTPGADVSAAELKAAIAQEIAPYKVPADIVFGSDFPKNAMNKTLKRELRDQYLSSRTA